ncbi:hypothetical protein NL676_025218 [Syzygium grande]|nr:hypothetical protein NL676_025218 [Syzygium grande]
MGKLIELLSLKYHVLASTPEIKEQIRALMQNADTRFLPPTHPFQTEFDEFSLTFEHGLENFRSNKAKIARLDAFQIEYWDKKDRARQANIVLSTHGRAKVTFNEEEQPKQSPQVGKEVEG